MKQLQLDSFVTGNTDMEFGQYKILSGLKEYRAEFNKNKLYPSLAELVYLSSQLEELLRKKNNSLSIPLPKGIKNASVSGKNVFVEVISPTSEQNEYFYDLIQWSLPEIKSLIEEAYILYDFIENNLEISEVGLSPQNKDEGYLIIPDYGVDLLQIYKYECLVYSTGPQPYRSLKTNFITATKNISFYGSIEFVKLELIKKYKEKPDVAAYYCNTDLNFPFNETIYPVAKRKLLTHLSELN